MGCFQVRYDCRVVIYERKMFIRLATGLNLIQIFTMLLLFFFSKISFAHVRDGVFSVGRRTHSSRKTRRSSTATTTTMATTSGDTIAGKRILGFTPTAGSTERTKLLRLRVIAGHNLAKKDIFGASDPYTRIDLVTQVRLRVRFCRSVRSCTTDGYSAAACRY